MSDDGLPLKNDFVGGDWAALEPSIVSRVHPKEVTSKDSPKKDTIAGNTLNKEEPSKFELFRNEIAKKELVFEIPPSVTSTRQASSKPEPRKDTAESVLTRPNMSGSDDTLVKQFLPASQTTSSFLVANVAPVKSSAPAPPPSADRVAELLSESSIRDKLMDEPAVQVSNVAGLIANAAVTGQVISATSQTPEAMATVKGLVENVHQVEIKLADVQADPNSPLFSATSFEELNLPGNVLKGVYAMKFNRPSKVQEKALPLLLSNPPQNLIAQSQSGTGKTAAFVLTMLCRVDENENYPQALCLTPSRELARQIIEVVRQMAQFTKIKVAAGIKDDTDRFQSSVFTEQIIVGTPGTVLDFQRRNLVDFKKLRVLVFDEADIMFDTDNMGTQSLRIKKACLDHVQTLLFSATFKDSVIEAAKRLVPHANMLALKREELSVDAIRQFYMNVPGGIKQKMKMLGAIYGLLTLGQSIIFAGSREISEQIQAFMELEGFKTCVLHGGMSPAERDEVIDAFRKGECRVLISTNVIARGIDVLQVSLVINFDMPFDGAFRPDPETYLHRIGRTGRFGRSGVSINFISDEKSRQCQEYIKNHFNRPINEISTQDLETLDKQLSAK